MVSIHAILSPAVIVLSALAIIAAVSPAQSSSPLHANQCIKRAVYFAFFGPLAKIPGPWYAKFTGLRLKYENVVGNGVHYTHALHQKYGSYVRIAPSKIAVSDPESVKAIHSIPTKFAKTEYYTNLTGRVGQNVFNMRNIKEHGHRRRLLGTQLSETSLREQEPTVQTKVLTAVDRMAAEQAAVGHVNVAPWATAMANDTIGQLSFGIPFGALDGDSKLAEAVRTISRSSSKLGEFPFLTYQFLRVMPILGNPIRANTSLRAYAGVAIRKYLQSDPKDLGPTLFNKIGGAGLSQRDIIQEAALYMIAGTDTTAITLTYLIWILAQRPDLQARLRSEIKTLDFDNQEIKHNVFIEGLINEALRLHGAASANLPRAVPHEGARMGPYYLPFGTDVVTQAWTSHRNPDIFPDPEEFRPERWENTTKEMTDNFYAFGGGARSCLGVHLARMELRLAIHAFFTRFPEKLELSPSMLAEDMETRSYVLITTMKGYRCLINAA